MKKLLLKLLLVIAIWVIGVQLNTYDLFELLDFFGSFIGMTFIPIIAIYFYRYKKKRKIKSLHKVFRFFVWLFIILLTFYAFSPYIFGYSLYVYPYHIYFDFWNIKELFIMILPSSIIIILLIVLLKINTSLIPKDERTKINLLTILQSIKKINLSLSTIIKQNIKSIIIICAITVVFLYGRYQWNQAGELDDFQLWELSRFDPVVTYMKMHQFYEMAFMRIIMFGGFVFGSLLLLMGVFRKK